MFYQHYLATSGQRFCEEKKSSCKSGNVKNIFVKTRQFAIRSWVSKYGVGVENGLFITKGTKPRPYSKWAYPK